jgi:hypothetical protein
MRTLAIAGTVALALMLGGGPAAANHKNHDSDGGTCTEQSFEHCMAKCIERGAKKSAHYNPKCNKHCTKKKC